MPAYDYTAWPTIADLSDQLSRVQSLTWVTRADDYYLQGVLDAVTQEVANRTKRQFIPATATRYFNGSGTGSQIVDEYVDVTDVTLVGFTGSTSSTLTNWYEVDNNLYPKTEIAIYQGGPPAFAYSYFTRFPQGRSNIGVTASWGYGSTIPQDLWLAVLQEGGARVSADLIIQPEGRLKSTSIANAITESYTAELPGEAAGWHARFLDRCRFYTSPKVLTPAARKPVMI